MYKIKNVAATVLSILGVSIILSSCSKSGSSTTITGNWITRSEFEGVARSEGISFVIGDSAYIGTGYDGTNRLSDIWQYDPAQDFWLQKADLPGVARSSAVAFTINNKGYIGTGYDGVNKLNDFWQYNPLSNSWAPKANFAGSARYDAVGFAVLNKGYISTGYDGNYLKDFWQYDDAKDSWTQMISMGGFKRSAAVAFVCNNKAYICTGNNNGATATVNDLWVFDPTATPYWTALREITNVSSDTYDDLYSDIVRNNAVAFVIGNYAYLTTGNTTGNGSLMTDTWQYDIANDLWSTKTAFEGVAREGALGFNVKGRGYVATGRSSTQPFDDIREFLPNEAYNVND